MKLKLATILLCACFSGLTWANQTDVSSVVNKLNKTVTLDQREVAELLQFYKMLGTELIRINGITHHLTTSQRRNLVSTAFRAQRSASLEYLKPNQFRRWMSVATRSLPQLNHNIGSVNVAAPSVSPIRNLGSNGPESWATVMYRASQGN